MNLRNSVIALVAVSALSALFAQQAAAQTSANTTAAPVTVAPIPPRAVPGSGGASPHETISARIGNGRGAQLVTITYGRPHSKKPGTTEVRKIWGTLVPWDKVWRMGSDEATTLITQVPLEMGGVTIPAGAYTLCMFPVENGPSKLIINKQIGQWGIPYTPAIEANELARVDLKKDTISAPVDQFTMAIENTPGANPPAGVIKMQWETTQYSVPFSIKQ